MANGRNPPLVGAIPYPLSFLFPLDATAPNTGMFKRIIIEPCNLQTFDQNINKELDREQKDKFISLINNYNSIFSQHEFDLGHNETYPFKIDTGDARPIKQRAYRTSHSNKEIIYKKIQELLSLGVIEKSYSHWASPVIIFKNKDGSNRMCVDYRKLNEVTKKNSYPLPLIDETFDTIGRARYFTKIDLAKGFYQFSVDPESREKTAIITHLGLFQFKRITFSLYNAPINFQRKMDEILGEVKNECVLVFIDDIICYSADLDSHLVHLKKVFKCLSRANLKIKLNKCQFAMTQVEFLGFSIKEGHLIPQKSKVDKILKIPVPVNRKQVRSFLGVVGYYIQIVFSCSRGSQNLGPRYQKMARKHIFLLCSVVLHH